MNDFVCLDTSVLVKFFIEEEDSGTATALMQAIIEKDQTIVLPAFAWAEFGTVLRQRQRKQALSDGEAGAVWQKFTGFPGIEYVAGGDVIERAWKLAQDLNLPTLYDASFLAVAEIAAEQSGETVDFWTADKKLLNLASGRKNYLRLLSSFPVTS